jgi:hypothetical protein
MWGLYYNALMIADRRWPRADLFYPPSLDATAMAVVTCHLGFIRRVRLCGNAMYASADACSGGRQVTAMGMP